MQSHRQAAEHSAYTKLRHRHKMERKKGDRRAHAASGPDHDPKRKKWTWAKQGPTYRDNRPYGLRHLRVGLGPRA